MTVMDRFEKICRLLDNDQELDSWDDIKRDDTSAVWMRKEIERLRRIEDGARDLEIGLDANGRAYVKHKLINLYETLAANPRPEGKS